MKSKTPQAWHATKDSVQGHLSISYAGQTEADALLAKCHCINDASMQAQGHVQATTSRLTARPRPRGAWAARSSRLAPPARQPGSAPPQQACSRRLLAQALPPLTRGPPCQHQRQWSRRCMGAQRLSAAKSLSTGSHRCRCGSMPSAYGQCAS